MIRFPRGLLPATGLSITLGALCFLVVMESPSDGVLAGAAVSLTAGSGSPADLGEAPPNANLPSARPTHDGHPDCCTSMMAGHC